MKTDVVLQLSALALLTAQTSTGTLLMRYSRLHNDYSSTTIVFLSEVVKTCMLLLMFLKQNDMSISTTWTALKEEIILKPKETVKLSFPGFLYSIQNNIVVIALTNLDAATFQITYQLKILTTCVISIFLLGTKICARKWTALAILTTGVVLVQLSHHNINSTDQAHDSTKDDSRQKSWALGLFCVLMACISSPLAGVYYEKLLKNGVQCSLIIRNLQMGIFSLIFGFTGILLERIPLNGMLRNFDGVVWTIVFLQGAGGIIVAAVLKYADNIQKGFATSISIIISCVVSYFLLQDLVIERTFVVGVFLVLVSTLLYSSAGIKPSKPPLEPVKKKTVASV